MQNLNREHAGIQCIVLCTHLQTTGRTILVGRQYTVIHTAMKSYLQEGGEYQCDCTIFDSFLEYKYTSAEYTKNNFVSRSWKVEVPRTILKVTKKFFNH